jgi:fumarylacetoacetase
VDLELFEGVSSDLVAAVSTPPLNALAALGPEALSVLRGHISRLLSADARRAEGSAVVPAEAISLELPFAIGDYSDFYTSIYHATNVGHMFRPGNPLFPNFKHMPVGYHGRSSSIVPNGSPIQRPCGQQRPAEGSNPPFGPSQRLDYELEIGAFVGAGNSWGSAIPIGDAEDHLFGLCLLNDWSARDVQVWESQPLGPFLAKSFATTISPWIVTLDALAPFRCAATERPVGDPAAPPYLDSEANRTGGGFDISAEVWLSSAAMRSQGLDALRASRQSFRDMYWTFGQMVAHHASNGCNLRPGDLIGSGTVSGPARDSLGCLLELTQHGPIALSSGETRTFLADGDEVVFRARCERHGFVTIGFGECRGRIAPAQPASS